MSEQPSTPNVIETTVRRAPRIGVFIAAGVVLGALVALVLTFAFGGTEDESVIGVTYSRMQVFGFLLLWCVPAGLAIGGIVAVILDRTIGRRTHTVRVDREVIITPDDEAETREV